MAASSSTHHDRRHLAAPPPTPSSLLATPSTAASADALSHLLHRQLSPPILSFPPTRRLPASSPPPTLSLSSPTRLHHPFFQLVDHRVPSQLAGSAESDSLALFQLEAASSFFPDDNHWPLGFNEDDRSFWFDGGVTSDVGFPLSSLRGLARALEELGLDMVETVSKRVGFENPFREDPARARSIMVVRECSSGVGVGDDNRAGGSYPFVVGLEYQIRSQKYSVLSDSGWVTVSPQVGSVFVTIGDIAQIWSNGKLKKVRGTPVPCPVDNNNSSNCISMTLLISLHLESIVSPLLTREEIGQEIDENDPVEDVDDGQRTNGSVLKEKRAFRSFPFEDYAWRVYNEPLHFKDPLDRYRV